MHCPRSKTTLVHRPAKKLVSDDFERTIWGCKGMALKGSGVLLYNLTTPMRPRTVGAAELTGARCCRHLPLPRKAAGIAPNG